MKKRFSTYFCAVALAVTLACSPVLAGDSGYADLSSQWDSAVSSLLLAAGMYGLDVQNDEKNLNPSFAPPTNAFKTLPSDFSALDAKNITLSYSGSSGRLGFSAGYIYTSVRNNQQPETLLVGLDAPQQELNLSRTNTDDSWYMALDYSKAFQVNDSFAFGIGSKAMLMKNPFDPQDGRILSMLLNLPMSYKNYFTLTPELQWSHTIPDATMTRYSKPDTTGSKDVFYGGMSISFSY